MTQARKTTQLQIRVTPAQKRAIQQAAARSRLDMSSFVLARVLDSPADQFARLAQGCAGPEPRFALAELNSLLAGLTPDGLREAVAHRPARALSPFVQNYLAAMVEQACQRHGVALPAWVGEVAPLAEPYFGSALESLRLHLLTRSPAPFRRRNLFVDASVGDRV